MICIDEENKKPHTNKTALIDTFQNDKVFRVFKVACGKISPLNTIFSLNVVFPLLDFLSIEIYTNDVIIVLSILFIVDIIYAIFGKIVHCFQ